MLTIDTARQWYPEDPTHGFEHILQVLHLAERIARREGADLEVVRTAALLHDATPPATLTPAPRPTGEGSRELPSPVQEEGGLRPSPARASSAGRGGAGEGQHQTAARLAHHLSSADFARQVLQAEGWSEERIDAVQHCIRAHRFRDEREKPQTLEAKVLFDADKLDAIGARGVARALGYAQSHGQPAYAAPSMTFRETGKLEPGEPHSAYHEYIFKLVKLKDRLYTQAGRALAEQRHQVMVKYFESLRLEMEQDKAGI